jgi:predicted Fe-Mo cluster-binding NifX family protein
MAQAILDCEALLCRGMGMGAYESMKVAGILPVVTDITAIEEAVLAYVKGQIVDHTERLH